MRKIIFYAVLLFTALGCQEAPLDEVTIAPSDELIAVTIQASMSDQEDDTRVSVSPDSEDSSVWKSEWQADDALVLVKVGATSDEDLYWFREMSIDDTGVARFSGEVAAGTYDVYCLKDCIVDSNGFRVDYSKQSAGVAQSCQNMPLKAIGQLVITSDGGGYDSSVMVFEHLAQVVKYKIDFSKAFESGSSNSYKVNYVTLSGYSSQEQQQIVVPVEDIVVSSSSEQSTVYCYMPPFTLEANRAFTLYMSLSQVGNEAIERKASATIVNNTSNSYDFAVGTLNTIIARYAEMPQNVNWIDSAAETFTGGVAYSDSVKDYTISTAEELALLAKLVNGKAGLTTGGKTFTLANDINLSGKEFTAIGYDINHVFKGVFEGAGHTISELYIDKSGSNHQGLFGNIFLATIKNLSVAGSVVGYNNVGGIVGYSSSATIVNCNNTASVKGHDKVGGVVGYSYSQSSYSSSITNCYNTASVKGHDDVGGIVGNTDSAITNCYNEAAVEGHEDVGGIVGDSDSAITNCYNTASVKGIICVGGIVGYPHNSIFTNCYWSGDVTDAPDNGVGSDGSSSETIVGSVTKMTTDAMKSASFSTILCNGAYTYNNVGGTPTVKACAWSATSGFPKLNLSSEPSSLVDYTYNSGYEIYTATGLTQFASYVNSGNYSCDGKLMCDIDLKSVQWTPIGNGEGSNEAYSGTFDGDGYEIVGLYVSGGNNNGMGLFKTVYGGKVQNLTVSGVVYSNVSNAAGIAGYARDATFVNCTNHANVSGTKYAGGIVGYCSPHDASVISKCVNTGKIYSSGYFAGGIAGKIFGKSGDDSMITSCANRGEVSVKERYAGGLAGANQGGWIKNSYNRGRISSESSGEVNVGGLAGNNERNGDYHAVIEYCYSSADVSGDKETGLVVGYNDSSSVNSCYYDGSKSGGEAIGKENSSYSVSVTAYESLSKLLADLKSHGSWAEGDDGFPILEFEK